MIKILENTLQNVRQVADIEAVCFGDEAWSENLVQSEFDSTLSTFVAYIVSNTVVGYASFRAVLDEMQVGNVAVLPQYRRQGIASTLLTSALRTIEQSKFHSAMLIPADQNSAKFYEKFGFKLTGELFDSTLFNIDYDLGTGKVERDFVMERKIY